MDWRMGQVLMRMRVLCSKRRHVIGQGDAILSLRPPRAPGLLVAVICALIAVGISLIQSAGYLSSRIALTAVGCLAIVAGLAAANVLHSLLEVRLERDGLLIRELWGSKRYLWRDILEPFHLVAGEPGPRVTFTWRSDATVRRAFVRPDCLKISAASLVTLLNDRWEQARHAEIRAPAVNQIDEATSEALGSRWPAAATQSGTEMHTSMVETIKARGQSSWSWRKRRMYRDCRRESEKPATLKKNEPAGENHGQ
jgi:hypothetical protein